MEGSIVDLRQGARNVLGSNACSYFKVGGSCELRPLYLCFGDIGGNDGCGASIRFAIDDGDGSVVDVYDSHCLVDGDGAPGVSSDEEQGHFEDEVDPIHGVHSVGLQRNIPEQVAKLYWAIRGVMGRLRIVKRGPRPRIRFNGSRFKRRFLRRGPLGRT